MIKIITNKNVITYISYIIFHIGLVSSLLTRIHYLFHETLKVIYFYSLFSIICFISSILSKTITNLFTFHNFSFDLNNRNKIKNKNQPGFKIFKFFAFCNCQFIFSELINRDFICGSKLNRSKFGTHTRHLLFFVSWEFNFVRGV